MIKENRNMICRKCGATLDDGSRFCYYCGEVFSEEDEKDWNAIDQKEKEIAEMEEAEIKRAVANMIYTTTPTIEGRKITKYLDIIYGSAVIGTGFISDLGAAISDLLGDKSNMYNGKLNYARSEALTQLKKAAIRQGADAVVGVEMDIMTVGSNMFVVNVSGTAVKLNDDLS